MLIFIFREVVLLDHVDFSLVNVSIIAIDFLTKNYILGKLRSKLVSKNTQPR